MSRLRSRMDGRGLDSRAKTGDVASVRLSMMRGRGGQWLSYHANGCKSGAVGERPIEYPFELLFRAID
jgi:hypothetical protein